MNSDRLVQTRSEETGCAYHHTLKDAFDFASNDPSVWKVSVEAATGERIRLVKKSPDGYMDMWVNEPLATCGEDD